MKKLSYCPICEKEHEFKIVEKSIKVTIKNEEVECLQKFYVCCETGEQIEFENGKLANENLLALRDAYREKHNLMTSKDIRNLREKYNLTQSELATILDWGEVTITRYETKQIQDEAHNDILFLLDSDPKEVFDRLQNHINSFSKERYEYLKEIVIKQIQTTGISNTKRKLLKEMYASYDSKTVKNGNKLLDIDKIVDMISYFAIFVPNLYKVKLMKLLWYADMLAFQKNGEAISGLVYLHEPLGALPHGHAEILALSELNVVEEYFNSDKIGIRITSNKLLEEIKLTGEEKNILDVVISKFKNFSSPNISEYMHKESAYINTSKNQIISYSYANELNPF